jgi:hypothetical protein
MKTRNVAPPLTYSVTVNGTATAGAFGAGVAQYPGAPMDAALLGGACADQGPGGAVGAAVAAGAAVAEMGSAEATGRAAPHFGQKFACALSAPPHFVQNKENPPQILGPESRFSPGDGREYLIAELVGRANPGSS